VLAVGQEVEAQIVKLEPAAGGGRGRIGLSLRALAPDPWSSVAAQFPTGTTVRGTVRRIEPFGAFVELTPGIDGLVHVSRMALERVAHPKNVVKVGDEVEVTVVGVETDKRRIALSMVETARRARDAAEHTAKREERELIAAKTSEGKSLGTFADLLAKSSKQKR
jgi:small subunit ribosomal protein S1